MFDFQKARENMVAHQLRTWEVSTPKVLHLMSTLPREHFVPAVHAQLAYTDLELPIAERQVMLAPKIVARALQALSIKPTDRVLQIGTGTGYITALLAQMAQHVYALEYFQSLCLQTQKNLADLGLHNVSLEQGNGTAGLNAQGPFDIILITASMPALTLELKHQMNDGGNLFAFIGEGSAMQATLYTRHHEKQWSYKVHFETVVPPLCAYPTSTSFIF